jgi:hypothetical protein
LAGEGLDCPYRFISIYVGGFELSSLGELGWFITLGDPVGFENCLLKFDSRLARVRFHDVDDEISLAPPELCLNGSSL